jgi:hypothetical protein
MINWNNEKLTLSQALLIFYIIIAGNFTKGLFNKQMITEIENNRMAQHMIAYIMLLVIINSVGGVETIEESVIYSIIGYVWFLFTTKLDLQINVIVVTILLIGYLYENKLKNKENELEKTRILSEEEKREVKNRNNGMRSMIIVGALGTTIMGTYLYGTKQITQHGGGFSINKYLFY